LQAFNRRLILRTTKPPRSISLFGNAIAVFIKKPDLVNVSISLTLVVETDITILFKLYEFAADEIIARDAGLCNFFLKACFTVQISNNFGNLGWALRQTVDAFTLISTEPPRSISLFGNAIPIFIKERDLVNVSTSLALVVETDITILFKLYEFAADEITARVPVLG